jgi:hypothetical protein
VVVNVMKGSALAVSAACAISAAVIVGGIVAGLAEPSEPLPELTDAQQIEIEQAEEYLIKLCLARHGFSYWVEPPVSAEERREFGYVIYDVAWAQRYGYGGSIQRELMRAKQDDPNLAYRATLSPADRIRYSRTLGGSPSDGMLSVELPGGGTVMTPRGGCNGEASDRLYGDRETWFRIENVATNLTPLYVPDLVRDPRFTTALNAWSACMRGLGYPYLSPDEIRSALPRLTDELPDAQAHATEVELAVAEARCANTSSLAEIARGLEREYSAPVRERYADEIATYLRLQHAALVTAREILDHAQPGPGLAP